MKKTKQQEIDELMKELSECQKDKNRFENMLDDLKNLLFKDRMYQHEFSDIYPEVVIMHRSRQVEDIEVDMVIRNLREQNEKFWLLIRSLSGDDTLEKEIEFEMSRGPIVNGIPSGEANFRR